MTIVFCLKTSISAEKYGFDSWTTENGLPQNTVTGITQSPDGFLWISTYDGLVRFDGLRFTIFDKGNSRGIINNRFRGVYADREGTIWAFTENGVVTIFRRGIFESFETSEGLGERIRKISGDENGRVVITTREKLYYFDNGKFVALPENKQRMPETSFSSKPHSVWAANDSATGIVHYKNGSETFYPLPSDFKNKIQDDLTLSQDAFEDSTGALWIGFEDSVYKLDNGEVKVFTAQDLFGEQRPFWIKPLLEDKQGNILFGTGDREKNLPYSKYFFKFNGARFEKTPTEYRFINAFIDRDGNFWFGTLGQGLLRLRRNIIETLSVKDGLAGNEVYPLIQIASGDIYIGTSQGMNLYRDGKFYPVERDKDNQILIYGRGFWQTGDGALYASYHGGFGRFTEAVTLHPIFDDVRDGFTDFAPDGEGYLWMASFTGLYKFREGLPLERFGTKDGLIDENVITLYRDKKETLWIGTAKGLSQYKDGKFSSFSQTDGVPEDFIREIYEDADGTIWIGTYGSGLLRYKDGKFFNYKVEDGLFNNGVFAILEDESGNFWMSCNRGIYRVSKQQLNDFADGKIQRFESFSYGESDGMLSTECNGGRHPSAIKTKDGKFWFPTMGGIAIVDPNTETANPNPPPVVIEDVRIDRKKLDVPQIYTVTHDAQKAVELQPGQSFLEIGYTGLSFIKTEQTKFKYKLEGFEKDWVDAGRERTAAYSYLPYGKYTFRVMAANADGVWNETGAAVNVIVHPYFYETWWFRILSALAVAAIVVLIYYLRVSGLKKVNEAKTVYSRRLIESQENERKRIAAELHDGLGQNLVVIKNRAMLGIKKGNDPTRVLKELNDISESAALALEEVREITNNLRPQLLDRLGLTKAIGSMCKKVSGVIELDCNIDEINNLFSEQAEISIYRIVQETLNNIIKHSGATQAILDITREENEITIEIKDNGKGFDAENVKMNGSGLGMTGLRERTEFLNGTLTIDSEKDSGTKILVKIPITDKT